MTTNADAAQPAEPELIFSRDFDAPRTLLFEAWTDSRHLGQWFCPKGFTTALCEVDARPGGSFRVHMRGPDGTVQPTKGEYREVTAPERLVYVDSWDDDRSDNPHTEVTVLFEDRGGTTRLSMYSSFTSDEQREEILAQGVIEGWNMFMDNLESHLATRQ